MGLISPNSSMQRGLIEISFGLGPLSYPEYIFKLSLGFRVYRFFADVKERGESFGQLRQRQ